MDKDIVDVIGAHVDLIKSGRGYKGRCPFHEEKTPSFIVSEEGQTFHCLGCGAHGTAADFLVRIEAAGD